MKPLPFALWCQITSSKHSSRPYFPISLHKYDEIDKKLKRVSERTVNSMNRATDTKYFVRWEPCGKEGTIPENAVPGGTYTNGETLYIGRQRVKQNKNEFIPGYILPSKMELTVSYGTGTKVLHEFEIMVSDYHSHLKWRKKSDIDQNPIRPVTGGCDAGFYEAYYIGENAFHTSPCIHISIQDERIRA